MTKGERTKYQREYARRKRRERLEVELAHELQTGARCPWPTSGGHKCGGILRTDVGALGRTVITCDWCERRRRGICRDCSMPVQGAIGRALRCATHKHVASRASMRASEERHHEARLESSRAYYRDNDDIRRQRNEYKRAWRKANPEKVREHKKLYIERHKNDPTSQYNRYHAKYRKKYRVQKRELERDRLVAAPPARKTSPLCSRCGKSTRWKPVHRGHAGRPWTVCTSCLFPCERKARLRNRRRALHRAKEWLESIPKPERIKRPPQMAQRGPGWERLCITPGCETVLTHRKKKCTKCRARDETIAAQRLASHRGRGRRTDLENVA
jgi:hypothetical protein